MKIDYRKMEDSEFQMEWLLPNEKINEVISPIEYKNTQMTCVFTNLRIILHTPDLKFVDFFEIDRMNEDSHF